ncbi:MAG: tetratricopeptide repeat protein [Candidatus Omnitrophica bacterium]|nr:tetratricopeptide repeat protein [Candidatus Omnitrophota bacterium]
MSEKKNVFIRYVLPLIFTFLGAVVFFVSYNHYLLDKSLANLKISLKKIETADEMETVRKIKAILDDTFIMEVAKKDVDAASLVEMEFSGNIMKNAVFTKQIKDAEYFIKSAVDRKEEKRSLIRSAVEGIILNIASHQRKENKENLAAQITKLKEDLDLYEERELQAAYLEIGKLYLRLKDLKSAFGYFVKAREINPETSNAEMSEIYMGLIHKLSGEREEAIKIFSKKRKRLSKELINFSEYEKADLFYSKGEFFESVKTLEDMFEKDPSSVVNQVSQFRAGYIYLYDLRDERKAFEAFKKLQEMAPGCGLAKYINIKIIPELADKYREMGFKFLKEGYRYLKEGKYEEALEQFNIAVGFNPDDALAHCGKGLALYFLKKNEESVKEASRAKEISPKNPHVVENLGYIYYHVGALDKAIEEHKKALKLNPRSYITHYNLGTLYIMSEDMVRGIYHLRKSIGFKPQFPYSHNNLGYALWYLEKYDAAQTHLEKAISLKPDYVDACYNLGVVFFETGDFSRARETFLWTDQLRHDYRNTRKYLEEIKKTMGY